MRFKIDENLPDALAGILREAGHDACTVRDQSLHGRPDVDIAAACRAEERAILTLDLDFADIRAFPPEDYAGFIVLRVRSQDKEHVTSIVRSTLALLETEALAEHLWIVEEQGVRIWRRA